MAAILVDSERDAFERDRIRIVDFLLCFPTEISRMRLPREYTSLRRAISRLPQRYEAPTSYRQAFVPIRKVEEQALRDMVSRGMLERAAYSRGTISPVAPDGSDRLQAVASYWKIREQGWYTEAMALLSEMPLNGNDGLKARTGLMEYRYD